MVFRIWLMYVASCSRGRPSSVRALSAGTVRACCLDRQLDGEQRKYKTLTSCSFLHYGRRGNLICRAAAAAGLPTSLRLMSLLSCQPATPSSPSLEASSCIYTPAVLTSSPRRHTIGSCTGGTILNGMEPLGWKYQNKIHRPCRGVWGQDTGGSLSRHIYLLL